MGSFLCLHCDEMQKVCEYSLDNFKNICTKSNIKLEWFGSDNGLSSDRRHVIIRTN